MLAIAEFKLLKTIILTVFHVSAEMTQFIKKMKRNHQISSKKTIPGEGNDTSIH
jgi:hypothetical protein